MHYDAVIKAIKGSIRKWRRIVLLYGKDVGPNNCPLCQLFYYSCEGCPIFAYSGKSLCEGTPYVQWNEHYRVKNLIDWWHAIREWWFLKKILRKYKKENKE